MFYEHFKTKMFLDTYNHASTQLFNTVVQKHIVFHVYTFMRYIEDECLYK